MTMNLVDFEPLNIEDFYHLSLKSERDLTLSRDRIKYLPMDNCCEHINAQETSFTFTHFVESIGKKMTNTAHEKEVWFSVSNTLYNRLGLGYNEWVYVCVYERETY